MMAAGARALFLTELGAALQFQGALEITRALQVVLLRQVPDRATLCALVAARVAVAVFSLDWLARAREWPACPGKAGLQAMAQLHLAVDTGLGREGIAPQDVEAGARLIVRKWPYWRLAGVFTKWCCVEDAEAMRVARQSFAASTRAVLRIARRSHGGTPLIHVGGGLGINRQALAELPKNWMLRIPTKASGPGLVWKTRICARKALPAGSQLGYCPPGTDCRARAGSNATIAVLPVGFSDFVGTSVKGAVGGEELPVLSLGASTAVVELPAQGPGALSARVGHEAVLCDRCGREEIPLHVPRLLVNAPGMEPAVHCPPTYAAP